MHLNTEASLNFLDGQLKKDQQAFWKGHIELCRDCAQTVRRWQQLRSDLRRSHLMNAPEQVLQNAVQILEPRPDKASSRFRTVFAAIVFDSFLQPAMAGARGISSKAARQLVMRAEEFDVHVKIWGDEHHRQMLGQLLPREGQNFVRHAKFHLLRNGERLESTASDEMGEFHFKDVPEGDLSLQIDLSNLTVIGALNLREEV